MSKQRPSASDADDAVVIKVNQRSQSCNCKIEKKEAAPFPFKEEGKIAIPVEIVSVQPTISSEGSESTLSVVTIDNMPQTKLPAELPLVTPREHGPSCALEVSVLEKHAEGCTFRKRDREGRNPIDDKIGSYDVVGRMVYRTCAGAVTTGSVNDNGDAIRNSAKSFKLNDPTYFGKDLKEQRSRVETLPILPNYDNCVMRIQTQKKLNQIDSLDDPNEPEPVRLLPSTPNSNLEVLSVYIRKDKSEKVPAGFQKMHYRGDSCKLHDPNERSRQIMALQKVIKETSSGAEIAKSRRKFSPVPERETQVMAAVASPVQLPKTLYAPIKVAESEESLESYKNTTPIPDLQPEVDSNSLDILPQRKSTNTDDDGSKTGFFSCFRRGRQRRQQRESYIAERDPNSRRVTHSDNQPRRHSGPASRGSRTISAQYSTRRN